MRKFLLGAVTSLSLSLAATTSQAADLMDLPVTGWAGLYAGLTFGYSFSRSEHIDPPGETGEFDIDGILGGGTVGYNLQSGSIVYGIEADWSFADISGQIGPGLFNPGPNSFTCGTGPCITTIDWFGTVRGRLGMDMGGILPYVTGGLAYAEAFATIPGDPTLGRSDIVAGWTAGGGVEKSMGGWSAKIEYLYFDLGSFRYGFAGSESFRASVRGHIVRGGINFPI